MRRIVRRGLAIAAGEGIDALTIHRLAAELDYTPGALYRYFSSRDALIAELQRSVIVFLGAAIGGVAARAAERSWPRDSERALAPVAAACLGFVDFARRWPGEFGFLSMYLSDPEYRLPEDEARYVHEATSASLAQLEAPLDRAAESGALTAGSAAARALTAWSALQGVLQTRKLARSQPSPDAAELAVGLVRTLLIGWGADAAAADRVLATVAEHDLAALPGSPDELLRPAQERRRGAPTAG
jgi:AcrR family transcriptional regulator